MERKSFIQLLSESNNIQKEESREVCSKCGHILTEAKLPPEEVAKAKAKDIKSRFSGVVKALASKHGFEVHHQDDVNDHENKNHSVTVKSSSSGPSGAESTAVHRSRLINELKANKMGSLADRVNVLPIKNGYSAHLKF